MKRRCGLRRPTPTSRPMTQPSSSAQAVTSTVTTAPRSNASKSAKTGAKSSIIWPAPRTTC
ncbi:Uncharacterised protein [Bordetella pertussis]|nr:Uncharacterised protein [Bordetella pertussis]